MSASHISVQHDAKLTNDISRHQHSQSFVARLQQYNNAQDGPQAYADEESRPAEAQKAPCMPASWSTMPNKGQLAILAFSRVVDFFQQASLQTYMVHQLKSFDETLPDPTISYQAGVLQGSFTAAQIITSILWGRAADAPSCGRKTVLLIGLVGTGFSMIGIGFSSSFTQAVMWRLIGGGINGSVGAARTMVAESVPKSYHSRAFLLLPAAFNVANILGPLLSAQLVDPVTSFPNLFGPDSIYGGVDGVHWMSTYPYAAPSLLCAFLSFVEAFLVAYLATETHKAYRGPSGLSSAYSALRVRLLKFVPSNYRGYVPISMHSPIATHDDDSSSTSVELTPVSEKLNTPPPNVLPFWRIWTPNVVFTLLCIAFFDFHMGAFSSLLIIFLSTARSGDDPSSYTPLHFNGGLAFDPSSLSFALSIIGWVGLALQFLLYPWANARFGLMRCFRYSLVLFPVAYFFAPYIALLPSATLAPLTASGFWIWTGIAGVLTLQVAARTFALPASIILLNNCSPHPSVLGTIHGIGNGVSATFRTLGPMAAGAWYALGLRQGTVVMAWWIVALFAMAGCVSSYWVRNGSGHEIVLQGDRDEDDGHR